MYLGVLILIREVFYIVEIEKIERYFEKLQSFATAHNFKGLDEMIYKYLGEARHQILQPRY